VPFFFIVLHSSSRYPKADTETCDGEGAVSLQSVELTNSKNISFRGLDPVNVPSVGGGGKVTLEDNSEASFYLK
jgi:hypothetical protein